jgi:hypothetical protein
MELLELGEGSAVHVDDCIDGLKNNIGKCEKGVSLYLVPVRVILHSKLLIGLNGSHKQVTEDLDHLKPLQIHGQVCSSI